MKLTFYEHQQIQVIYLTEQLLDIFLAHQFSNLPDGLNFLGVNLYVMFMYYNTQEPSDITLKVHFNWFIRSPYFFILSNNNFKSAMCTLKLTDLTTTSSR
jgi:hypothetical protein